jgi:hypothetical protein
MALLYACTTAWKPVSKGSPRALASAGRRGGQGSVRWHCRYCGSDRWRGRFRGGVCWRGRFRCCGDGDGAASPRRAKTSALGRKTVPDCRVRRPWYDGDDLLSGPDLKCEEERAPRRMTAKGLWYSGCSSRTAPPRRIQTRRAERSWAGSSLGR